MYNDIHRPHVVRHTRQEFEDRLRKAGLVIQNERYGLLSAWYQGARVAISDTTRGIYDQLAARFEVELVP